MIIKELEQLYRIKVEILKLENKKLKDDLLSKIEETIIFFIDRNKLDYYHVFMAMNKANYKYGDDYDIARIVVEERSN